MNKAPERVRVFCAVELPNDVRARVVDYMVQLRASAPTTRATWAREEALHLTLKFFGEVDSQLIPVLIRASTNAAKHIETFSLALDTTGSFPTHGAPRVLWIGVTDTSGHLMKLQQAVEDECELEGFGREKRAFHPHLTIARQRAPQGSRTAAVLQCEPQFSKTEFSVREFVVMRSELRPEGSRYTKLSQVRLAGT